MVNKHRQLASKQGRATKAPRPAGKAMHDGIKKTMAFSRGFVEEEVMDEGQATEACVAKLSIKDSKVIVDKARPEKQRRADKSLKTSHSTAPYLGEHLGEHRPKHNAKSGKKPIVASVRIRKPTKGTGKQPIMPPRKKVILENEDDDDDDDDDDDRPIKRKRSSKSKDVSRTHQAASRSGRVSDKAPKKSSAAFPPIIGARKTRQLPMRASVARVTSYRELEEIKLPPLDSWWDAQDIEWIKYVPECRGIVVHRSSELANKKYSPKGIDDLLGKHFRRWAMRAPNVKLTAKDFRRRGLTEVDPYNHETEKFITQSLMYVEKDSNVDGHRLEGGLYYDSYIENREKKWCPLEFFSLEKPLIIQALQNIRKDGCTDGFETDETVIDGQIQYSIHLKNVDDGIDEVDEHCVKHPMEEVNVNGPRARESSAVTQAYVVPKNTRFGVLYIGGTNALCAYAAFLNGLAVQCGRSYASQVRRRHRPPIIRSFRFLEAWSKERVSAVTLVRVSVTNPKFPEGPKISPPLEYFTKAERGVYLVRLKGAGGIDHASITPSVSTRRTS